MDISRLPPEIMTSILRRACYSHSKSDISSSLLVSRQWSQIVYPLAWESVVINTSTLTAFNKLMAQSPHLGQYIRSLTLQLHTIWPTKQEIRDLKEGKLQWYEGATPSTVALWRSLKKLAEYIASGMPNLVSFSLRINKYIPLDHDREILYNEPHGAYMRSHTLACLLRALPRCCVDLELDTRGRDDEEYFFHETTVMRTSEHLCVVLRELLPRLRHLHLRLGWCCPDLLISASKGESYLLEAPNLLSLVLNLNTQPHSGGPDICQSFQSREKIDAPFYRGRKLQACIEPVLINAIQDGAFPRAYQIQLMILLGSQGRDYSHFIQQDFITQTSYTLPFRLIWFECEYEDREYMARTRSNQEMFGNFGSKQDLEDEVEGTIWSTTAEGYRWSADFYRTGDRQLASTKAPEVETRSEFLDRHTDDMRGTTRVWALNTINDFEGLQVEVKPLP